MSCSQASQEHPRRKALILTTTALAIVLVATSSSNTVTKTDSNIPIQRRLWAQNIYWAGNPNDVPPPPPPPPPAKPPKHYYQPVPAAPRPPPKGNPFEKFGEAGSDSEPSTSSGFVSSPPPPPPPAPAPVPVLNPSPTGEGAISSNSYYSRPDTPYMAPAVDETQQTTQSFVSQEVEVEQQPALEIEKTPIAAEVVQGQGFSGTLGSPGTTVDSPPVNDETITQQQTVQQQTAPTIQTSITSSLELNGVPTVIPPSGSMELMALMNLLVHRIESKLDQLLLTDSGSTIVKDVKILSIGGVDVSRRLLRSNKKYHDDKYDVVDRLLSSNAQMVKFQAMLEFLCGEEDQDSCMEGAKSATDGVMEQLAPVETTTTSSNVADFESFVDNEGEDWNDYGGSTIQESFVYLPDPSMDVGFEIITESPTSHPTSHPSNSPSASPITPMPTSNPTFSPMATMQSYSVSIEISTPSPTSAPTTNKPTSPSAITENEWFTTAGLFVGDATKRYCGFDWADVTSNCLTATPCPEGHAEGICPYGQSCIADTPCNEIRAQQQSGRTTSTVLPETTTAAVTTELSSTSSSSAGTTGQASTATATQPTIEATPSQTVPTTTTSTSSESTTIQAMTTEQSVEQVQPQDMGMMMSNTNPSTTPDDTPCTLHSDCHNQLCGLPNSGFEGICVDCLFTYHVGCRASQICLVSFSTGMPSCQDKPAVGTSTTTTTTTTTTRIASTASSSVTTTATSTELPEDYFSTTTILPQDLSMPTEYRNPSDNVYFCGRTHNSISDACLQSKPCPSGIAAIHCGLEEGCFAHSECQAEYEAFGATTAPDESMNAFAAFDSSGSGVDGNVNALEGETSFWASTWRDSSSSSSLDVSMLISSIFTVVNLVGFFSCYN